jgi:hypothetical protein
MITHPRNKKMTVDITFANGEVKNYQTASFLDLNLQDRILRFSWKGNGVYINLNNVNEIKFIEEKETEEDAD